MGIAVLLLTLAAVTSTLAAQTPGQLDQLRRDPALVLQQLQALGLTPAQVRARLVAAGYPADVLDPYLAGVSPTGETETLALEALQAIVGPFEDAMRQLPLDTGIVRARRDVQDSRVFGLSVFRRNTSQFLPTLAGPVPPNYLLGPGDVLVLILTGAVELTHTLPVTREGFILIPQVGQVQVANLTMTQLRDLLYTHLSRAYSGIRRGPDPSTQFDVTVASVRPIQVYVVGEVIQPGAYQISGLGTALTALYAAGGPLESATLRRIEVRRAGRVVSTLDLYDYLLRGDVRDDVHLETGDVIFVGLHGPRVDVTGGVPRPGIYELSEGDNTLAAIVQASGGLSPNAQRERLTVHRLLSDSSPAPSLSRRLALSVPFLARADGLVVPALPLQPGDSVVVDTLPPLDAGYHVTVAGQITKSGRFPWRPGMTVRDLIQLGQGVLVSADLREVEIARMPPDGQDSLLAYRFRIPLDSSYLPVTAEEFVAPPGPAFLPPGGAPEVSLQPYDQVLILSRPGFEPFRSVTVSGRVRRPGAFVLSSRNDRLSDIIAHAGGLDPNAYSEGMQLYRRGVTGRLNADLPAALAQPGSAADLRLENGDSIHVPEYSVTVRVEGAVISPSSVVYREDADFMYYVNGAGGFAANADEGRTSVTYANGSRRVPSRFLFWRSYPRPRPGSVILVPEAEPREPFNTAQFLASITQIVASAVAIVAIVR